MSPARPATDIRPQVVGALVRAHHRSRFRALLWVRLRYRPNAGEEGMAAREYLKTAPRTIRDG